MLVLLHKATQLPVRGKNRQATAYFVRILIACDDIFQYSPANWKTVMPIHIYSYHILNSVLILKAKSISLQQSSNVCGCDAKRN